jgi:hypothetical protein
VRLRIQEKGNQPKNLRWSTQYFRPFHTTLPPRNTTNGIEST